MPRAGPSDEKKKSGGAAATQSNERELREALDLNVHRSLKDIAKEVSDSERTSRAEKTKQLFAMVWYEQSSKIMAIQNINHLIGSIRHAKQQRPRCLAA